MMGLKGSRILLNAVTLHRQLLATTSSGRSGQWISGSPSCHTLHLTRSVSVRRPTCQPLLSLLNESNSSSRGNRGAFSSAKSVICVPSPASYRPLSNSQCMWPGSGFMPGLFKQKMTAAGVWNITKTDLRSLVVYKPNMLHHLDAASHALANLHRGSIPHFRHAGLRLCSGGSQPRNSISCISVKNRSIQPSPGQRRSYRSSSEGSQATSENWWDNNIIWCIFGVNFVVFVFWQNVSLRRFMAKHFALSTYGVLYERRYHTIITSLFSHYDHVHILTNMFTLWFFGAETAVLLGAKRFLALYMTGGIVSSVCQVYWPILVRKLKLGAKYRDAHSPYQLGLGASGALNAVVAYSILSFPQRTILLYFVLPVPAAVLGLLFLGKDIIGLAYDDGSMGNAAHVGGTLYGGACFLLLRARGFTV